MTGLYNSLYYRTSRDDVNCYFGTSLFTLGSAGNYSNPRKFEEHVVLVKRGFNGIILRGSCVNRAYNKVLVIFHSELTTTWP